MATNFYFNNYQSSQEQELLENLVIESIKMWGEDMFYIPRKLNNYDSVYGEDSISSFEKAYPIEIYIKSVEGFTGDGTFFSNVAGLEIRDRIIFTVARRTFQHEVGRYTQQIRPNEGDLIYFPLNQKAFQIKYVNKMEMFYQLGALQTWELTCELFEYGGENFNTGIEEIDQVQTLLDTNVFNWGILDEEGYYLTDEFGNYFILDSSPLNPTGENDIPGDDSDEIQQESDQFVDFTQQDPFSERNI